MYTAPDDKLPLLGALTPGQLALDVQPIGAELSAIRACRLAFAKILDDMREIVEGAELDGTKYLARVAATLVYEASEAAIEATKIHHGSAE